MPTPRPEMLAKVANYLAKFKGNKEVQSLSEPGAEGTAYIYAQTVENPKALSLSTRIPHIMERETGDILWSGDPGHFHSEGYDVAFAKLKAKNPDKPVKGTSLLFLQENPKHITWEVPGKDIEPQQYETIIKSLQTKFDKPVIDEKTNKIYGISAGLGVGVAAPAAQAQEQNPLYLKIQAIKAKQDPLRQKIEKLKAKAIQSKKDAQDLPNEISEPLSQQERFIDRMKEKYINFIAGLFSTPEQLKQFKENPDEVDKTLKSIIGLNVTPAYFVPDPERDIKLIARAPGEFSKKGATLDTTLTPVFATLDLAGLGFMAKTASKWGKKFIRPSTTDNVTKIVTPEQISKEFAATKVHSQEALQDPAIANAEQLQFEFEKYYTPKDDEAVQGLLNLEDVSRSSTLRGKPGHLTGKGSQPFSAGYQKMQTLGKDMPEDTDMFPGFKSERPQVKPTPEQVVANESQQTMLVYDQDQPLWKAASRRFLASTTTALLKAGPVGKEIIKRIHTYQDNSLRETAKAMSTVKPFLSKLSKKELENFVDVLDDAFYNLGIPELKRFYQGIKPISKRVADTVKVVSDEQIKATLGAKGVGLEVSDIPRGFVPHLFTAKRSQEKAFLDYLKKTKQAASDGEALTLFNQWAKRYADMEFKGMEKARTLHIKGYQNYKNLGFETDPNKFLESYFYNAYKRIESIKQFGEDGHKGFDILKTQLAATSKNDAFIADELFKHVTGRLVQDTILQKILNKVINFHVVTYMGLAGISQLSAVGNILIRTGWRNTAVGTYDTLRALFRKEGDILSERSGAVAQTMINDLREMYGSGWISDKYLKITGTTPIDALTRHMAVHSGKYWIKDIVKGIRSGKNSNYWNRAGEELHLDVKSIKNPNYKISTDDLDLALQRVSNVTVGRTRATEMPLWTLSPMAKVALLFKKFMIFQTKFMKDNAFKPLVSKGTPLGKRASILSAFVLGQYPLGYLLGETRSAVSGRDRPEGLMKVIDNLAFVQSFGMWMDFTLAASKGSDRALSWVAGPVINNFAQTSYALFNSMKNVAQGYNTIDDHKALVKKTAELTIKPVPYIGSRTYLELMDNMYPEMRIKETPVTRR
jgi:hypothetical protein